jgi:hypothetical protein
MTVSWRADLMVGVMVVSRVALSAVVTVAVTAAKMDFLLVAWRAMIEAV